MSLGELFLTLLVALLVLGPDKIPMLTRHAVQAKKKLEIWHRQWQSFWDTQLKAQMLLDNEERATRADQQYQSNRGASETDAEENHQDS